MQTEKNIFAHIISVLFHPLLMPIYGLFILLNSNTHYSFIPEPAQRILYIIIFLSTFLIPISIIPFLMSLKIVNTVQMKDRKERYIPMIITAASYTFSLYLINSLGFHVPIFVKFLVFAPLLLVLINMLINIKWKISSHMIGIGGLIALVFAFSIIFYANLTTIIIALIIIAGAVATARLKLQVHTPMQIYAGFFLGFTGMLVIIYLTM